MLRGGAWSPATFLTQKLHKKVCWRNFAASEKMMPRAFPGYQDKWPILSTLRVLFCPLAPAPPQPHIQPRPALILHNRRQHTPRPTRLQHCSQEGEKKPTYFYAHVCFYIYICEKVSRIYIHTKNCSSCGQLSPPKAKQGSVSHRVWPRVVMTGASPAPMAGRGA